MAKRIKYMYVTPEDGYVLRSIGETQKESRELINLPNSKSTYRDWERMGYKLKRIEIEITILNG